MSTYLPLQADEIWEPICKHLWPVLNRFTPTQQKRRYAAHAPPPPPSSSSVIASSRGGGGGAGGGGNGEDSCPYFSIVRYRGRCLNQPGLLIVTPRWPHRYRLR